MLIKKVKNTIAVVAKVVQSLTNNSETDVPSVKAVKDAITTTIVTGQEYETGRVIDGKKEYGKRINCGKGPNNNRKEVDTNLSNVFYLPLEGIVTNGEITFNTNSTRPLDGTDNGSLGAYIQNNKIILESKTDRSGYDVIITIYYFKN